MTKTQFKEYGNEEIWRLSQYYLSKDPKFSFEKDVILIEWHNMKVHLHEVLKRDNFNMDPLIYVLTDSYFENGYEGIIELINIETALPSSNAEVERGFSALNRIKALLRNSMCTGRLDDLMAISLNGQEPKEWSPVDSFNYWFTVNNIRYM